MQFAEKILKTRRVVRLSISILCVVLISIQSIFAADFEMEIPEEYQYQTTNVFPGVVESIGWGDMHNALSQDVGEDALFGEFNSSNSTEVQRFGAEQNAQTSNGGDAGAGQSESPENQDTGGSSGNPESSTTDSNVAPAPTEEVSDVALPEQSQSVDDAPTEEEAPTESVSESPVSAVFEMVKGVYAFAVGEITEFTEPDVVANDAPSANETPAPETETSSQALEESTNTPADETGESSEVVVGEGVTDASSEPTTEEITTSTTAPEPSFTETVVPATCDTGKCFKHILEFADFTVGDGFEDQQITNMQLRVSLAARPHSGVAEDAIRVEYLHYDYWIDGGTILITDEVSNAINGGYQLFGFPLYSEWDEMSRIKVRFTYESDNEHLSDISIDSVWLEVESINGNAFNESALPQPPTVAIEETALRTDLPSGYHFDSLSNKSEFELDETPQFKFRVHRDEEAPGLLTRIGRGIKSLFGFETVIPEREFRMRVVNKELENIAQVKEVDGEFVVDVPKRRQFKPGKQIITVEVTDGEETFLVDKEFSWGVLALNVDKSIYLPSEESYLQIGVIDDRGHTICDAELSLEITAPNGDMQTLATSDGSIKYGNECAGDTYTVTPDYDAQYQLGNDTGTYALKLTAVTANGTHSITDSFEVRESVPFDIVRTGPTRIYPPHPYPVTLEITAYEDYEGTIVEYMPVGFQAYTTSDSDVDFRTHEEGDTKQLLWEVSLTAGETMTLAYTFDAPDVSPEFYLLGPLEIGAFKEIREWQIASDAPDNAVIVQSVMGTPASATTYNATFGTAPTAGNTIIMLATHTDGASAFNAPAAYLTQAVLSNATVEVDSGIWYASANPASTTYSITKTGGNQTGVVYLMEVSGLDTSNLLDVTISNDQTASNSLTASTSLSATSTQYGFAVAGITFADNDFAVPTSASWSSASANAYTQQNTINWATGNDGTFSIATANVNPADQQGATQVLTVGGTEQRNSVLAVFKLLPQSAVIGARGNQTSEVKINTNNNYIGGAFTVLPSTGYATVTNITIAETGTTDAQNDLSSIRLYYELDTVTPFDCASATYNGTETQYGATSTSFTSANGTATFTANVLVATTSMMCVYPVMNIDSSATAGHTLELQITTPNTQVTMSEGSTTPGTAVLISDTSTLVVGFAPTAPTTTNSVSFPFMKSTTTQPTLGGFVATDPDNDTLEYQIILDDDELFGSPLLTVQSSDYPTDAGWASTTFASGATTTYRIQTPLTAGTTYWWKVRSRDPFNTNTWSGYSRIQSFTVSDSISVREWFQTTDAQFATSTTLVNASTTGSGSVEIANLNTAISVLSTWSLGTTKATTSGTDRLLVVAIYNEDSATDNINTVTYGGQTMTEIYDQTVGAGFSGSLWVGYLNDASITAAIGTTIVPTWTPGNPVANDVIYHSAIFGGVDQTSPVRSYSPNALTSGASIAPTASTTVYAGDMVFYAVGSGDAVTYTPHAGYTEGTDSNTCAGGCSSATAYKAITTDGTELPTATLSGSANRVAITLVALQPRISGTVLSPEVDFDLVSGQTDWGEVSWSLTQPSGDDSRLQVYYSATSTCDSRVPNAALPGNTAGFTISSSPLNISSLSTSTYNRICLKMTLDTGTATSSAELTDWNISWELRPVFNQSIYQWYANTASATPSDTWPVGATSGELGTSTAINSTNPTKQDDVLRLRIGVNVTGVSATTKSFALQYAEGEICSADMDWAPIGAIGSTTALWRGYNNAGLNDGQTLASSTFDGLDILETYEEESTSSSMPNTITVGQRGEWDWVLQNNALAGTNYCFRMLGSDGTPFATYTQYPQLVTNQSPTLATIDTPFDNEKISTTTPVFEFTGIDPEADSLDYQIQIDNDADFSSAVIDTDSASNLVDFLNIALPSDKSPFNDSATLRYTIPSTLTNGTTYWWRVRTIDTNGSAEYGDWATARSFTVDTSVIITTWHQTTEEQFDTDTLVGIDATGSDLVTLISGSTTGTTTSSEIDFDDVTTGNAWGNLSWNDNETTGDIKHHIEYYDGSAWTLIPDSSLTGNATGFDTSPVDLIDLDTETYNLIRIRSNFTNSGGAPTLSDWTVTWGLRVAVVTHVSLFDNEKVATTTPTFTFYTTDPQGDSLEYEFSWSTDATFTTGTTTRNSSSSAGFTNTEAGGDLTPFNSGDTISYRISTTTALTNNTTYWWRVRARDPLAGNSYSFWSEPWSFTVDITATTSTWFQTTQAQFNTDTLLSLVASTTGTVSTVPAGVTTYNFAGVTNPSATHIARYFEVGVNDPTDPPTVDEIDTLTNSGTTAGTPNIRSGLAGYAGDVEASTAQYTALSSSNDSSWTTTDPGNTDQAIFWAEFRINEDPSDIDQLDILVEARQGGAPPVGDSGWFGIWRPGSTTPYWQVASSSQRTADATYSLSITANISDYFDGNNRIHLIYFNEDDSDPVIIDYAQVVVTNNTADSGTLTSTPLDFNDGSGPAWGQFMWTDSEPGLSTIKYQLQYLNSSDVWTLIPDSALTGNAAGFGTSPVDLRFLDTDIYNEIRAVANLTCSFGTCPTLSDWTIEWSRGFTITGTAFENDGVSSTTSGTVAVAVNGNLQIGKTGSISNGAWSISNVTFFEDDIVTVFADGASSDSEAVAITKYDGVPDMSGMRLQKRYLTIGSDDYTTITNADIELYDFTDDEDLFFDIGAGNDLVMCADTGCGDASIAVRAGSTYSNPAGADITAHDFLNNGTFVSGANTLRFSGSWDNNATSTLTGSTVIFTATSSTESIDETGALLGGFNNVTLGETSGSAVWRASSTIDINGNLVVSRGTFNRGTTSVAIAGNLTTEANGFWTGMGTTTFDGTNPSTWTDQNAVKQNIGRVVVDGTSKTLLLGSETIMQSMYIGANDTFDASATGFSTSVYGDWINLNTFVPRTGTVTFIATTTNRIITAGGDAFYNLSFNGVGGSWSFTENTLSITNDLRVATGTVTMPTGTTTISGSFSSVGGTFAHNNALILFNSSSAETISASTTTFINTFYNLRFEGSGSWSFIDTNATTSNDITIAQGTVTFPSNSLAVGGSFTQTGGSFAHNSGTVRFVATSVETIDITSSSFNSIAFTRAGDWSFIDSAVTVLDDINVASGTVTLPSGTLTVGGSFTNTATTTHNSGTVLFNSTDTGETISLGNSALYNMTMSSATGGWTITGNATTTNNFTLTSASSFVLDSGRVLAVGGVFTNSIGGASTTWTGSTLSLEAGAYSINTKTNTGDAYAELRIKGNTDIQMWNSTSTLYTVASTASLYSQDHNAVDGELYIFGEYVRTSGTEHWSYATDFDGTALTASTSRQVDVRFASGTTALIGTSTLSIVATSSATTTIANQGTGTYTIDVLHGTTTASFYDFANLGATGLRLASSTKVTAMSDGRFISTFDSGTALTISSSTIDRSTGLQIYRVHFSTTTAITARNVTQNDGTPASYWWFRESSGNIGGEAFDNDTGDPGSIRWDDSSLTISVSGVVYSDDGVTPMGTPTCDGSTSNVRVVVNGGASYTGTCASGTGVFTIGGVAIVGDPVLTVYLDTNGGAQGTVVTRTPTGDISNLNIYANRVITRHEDTAPLTILNMAVYDVDNDSDIRYNAATGNLTVFKDTELHIASSTTFVPGGDITIHANASSTSFDGSLHIDDNATFTGGATSTYTIGGSFTLDSGATFTSASSTVLMNATTTGKTITTTASQEITFNTLTFNGAGGGWNLNGDVRVIGEMAVSAGTLTGTSDVHIVNGSLSGNGVLSFGAGTTTIDSTNTLGGTTAWTFANLVLGNGLVMGTTTPASNATTTILGKLTIGTAHFLDAGSSMWNLAGTGNVFVENGTFLEDTSTVRYSGAGATNILSTNYYNLDLKAQALSPTYTATGLGIVVSNNLTIGGATTTVVNFDTVDTALDVNGSVTIDTTGTLVGSGSGTFTVAGDWENNGTYTSSGGTVTFDGGVATNISAGSSSFGNVSINGAGAFTLLEHATATSAFTLTNAGSFTLLSGQTLAVGGTFANGQGGGVTTWTGSTLRLFGGGNYTINTNVTSDSYETLSIASGTQIRMWNSSATSYDVHTTGSLYSQDHGSVNGDLYIYGAYTKTTGTDYWSYNTDFDGTDISGSPRNVDTYIANGGAVLYTGGALAVIGDPSASTTLQNQGSGTYTFRIGGNASTTWNYYRVRDTGSDGLTFSGTPSVQNLAHGDFEVSQNSGTAVTVGGTVINQNPAKTFTNVSFATSSGVSPAFNVTATGTSVSSWRFTNHTGAIAGEAFDSDAGGDPGYLVWDDSAALITISGYIYADEGTATSTVCDGSTNNITLRVAGLTTYQTSCSATTGAYSISNVAYSPADSFVAYIDGEAEKGATVSADPISNVTNMDIYENRVIVRHENTDPLTIVDMSFWDSSDDADIPFTAVDSSPDTLSLPANRKLIVWTGKEFEPNGNVTIAGGGGGSAYDGTLELYTNATFDATGSESHTIGGSLLSGTGSVIDDETSTFTFTTTGSGRTVDTNEYALYNAVFNGAGSWTVTNTALDIANDLTITQGVVTLPSGTTTISGSIAVTGGSFNANGGTVLLNATGAETIRTASSNFSTLTINSTGSYTVQGSNATVTAGFTILDGTFTSATGTLTVGGDFINRDTFTHGSGILRFTSGGATNVTTGGSDLYTAVFAGAGTYTFTNTNVALLGSLSIQNGAVNLATGTMSIGGSFLNTGGTFTHATGTLLFNSTDTGETINAGGVSFNNVTLASASGGWTITNSATTTGNFSLTSATSFTQSSSTVLTIGGLFTNLVGGGATTWTGSTIKIVSGVNYTINSKTAGGDAYNNLLIGSSTALRIWDSSALVTMQDSASSLYSQDHAGVAGSLYIFGNYARTTGSDYWSYATDFDGVALGGGSRQVFVYIASGATTTLTGGALNIVGTNSFDTTISNQGSGTYALSVLGGTFNAQYYSLLNMDASGLRLEGTPTISSLTEGNFTLAVNGGALITLSSTTLNYNSGLTITGASFATTSAITGYNIAVIGTTPSTWTVTAHTGNFDGEVFDNDGGDDCGSVRWDDSECLLTQQSGYRWRNDDGGEGVPNSEWYNLSWGKRKRVTATNADTVGYTNPAIKMTVTYDSDMQSDFDDLRFTTSDGVTPINHFVESYTASTQAVVWVEVPTLATSTDTEIYMYYNNGAVSDGSATSTFNTIDTFEDNNISEYSGDTAEFTVDGNSAYERTYRLEASDPDNGKTDLGGMYNNGAVVARGETIRFLKYIDTGTGSGDEVCTLFGTQTQTTNYAVCFELFGNDRVSLARDVDYNDTSGTVLATTSITYSTGWYEVEVDWGLAGLIGVTVLKDSVVVATTSATDTNYTSGGIGYALWFYHGAWDVFSSRPTLQSEPSISFGYEQVPGGASWLAGLNVAGSGIEIGDTARVRFLIENTGLPVVNQNYEIEYAEKGGSPSCESVNYNDYVEVPSAGSCGVHDICMAGSTHFTNLASTVDLLGGEGTFTPGQIVEDPSNNTGNITINGDEYTELEYAITPTSNVSDSSYCLRVTNEGADLDAYTRVAAFDLTFEPTVSTLTFNNGADIILTPGATTTVYATGTATDLNGYTDLIQATSTMYRSDMGPACSADNNNCYISSGPQCTFTNCAGNSCDVECRADIYYIADPTDAGSPNAGLHWAAYIEVVDSSGAIAVGSSPITTIDMLTLRALDVADAINYGSLSASSTSGSFNASTTVQNIGNDIIDISIQGTDLTDGGASIIPVSEQVFATSTFTYESCVFCTPLDTTPINYEVDLSKPTSTTTPITDEVFWGIRVPYGVSGLPHQGNNVFSAISDT